MLATTLLLLLAAQRSTAIVPNPDDPPPPVRPQACRERSDDITVCAPMSRERMAELEARYAEKPIRPDFTVPDVGTGTVNAVQRELPGASAPAMMVTLTIPFGAKKEKKEADDK